VDSIQIEIAEWFFNRLALCFFQTFLKLARQHVVFFLFGFPGLAELVLSLPSLLGKYSGGIIQIHARSLSHRCNVRKDDRELRIHFELRLAAWTRHFNGVGFLGHGCILRHSLP
jgi:hypothetical protein